VIETDGPKDGEIVALNVGVLVVGLTVDGMVDGSKEVFRDGFDVEGVHVGIDEGNSDEPPDTSTT